MYRDTIIQAIQDFMINLKTQDYTNYSWLVKTQPNQLQAAIAAYDSHRFPTRILFSKLSVRI